MSTNNTFIPQGGYPPLVRISDTKTPPSNRGFVNTVVKITDIFKNRRPQDLLNMSDDNTESGYNLSDSLFYQKPVKYDNFGSENNIQRK